MALPKLPFIVAGIILLAGLVVGVVLVQRPLTDVRTLACEPGEQRVCDCRPIPDCKPPLTPPSVCGACEEYACWCVPAPTLPPNPTEPPPEPTSPPTSSPIPTFTPIPPIDTATPLPPGTPTPTATTPPTPTPTLPLCPKPGDLNLHCIWNHEDQCFKVNLRWNPVSGVSGYTWELYKNPDRPPAGHPIYQGEISSCGRTCDAFSGCVNEATATAYWGRVTGHNSCQVNWAASVGCTSIEPPSPTPSQAPTETPTPTEPPICPKPDIDVAVSC